MSVGLDRMQSGSWWAEDGRCNDEWRGLKGWNMDQVVRRLTENMETVRPGLGMCTVSGPTEITGKVRLSIGAAVCERGLPQCSDFERRNVAVVS